MTEPTGEPRIPPLPPTEWPPEMKQVLGALQPPDPRLPFPPRDPSRPKGLNILGTLAQYPRLAQAYHTFNGHILFGTSLSVRQRELLVLRVAHRRECEYEWRQHAVLAGDVGLTDDLDRIRTGPDAEGWSTLDAALLRAVDELIDDACIGGSTWATLAAELDTEQLMDVVFTVGAYDVLAMAMLSFAIPLDDDLPPA